MTAHAGNHYWRDRPGPPFDRDPRAACRGADPELFFLPDGMREGPKLRHVEAAKAVCRRCPLIDDCAAWSLAERIPYGVWGGMSEDERAAELRGDQDEAKARRTRCGNGHLLDETNAYTSPSQPGVVRCRACGRENSANSRTRRHAAAVTTGAAA